VQAAGFVKRIEKNVLFGLTTKEIDDAGGRSRVLSAAPEAPDETITTLKQ
jgi:hypothetical protein